MAFRLTSIFLISVALLTTAASDCNAQGRFEAVAQRPLRFLGHGWGNGYHSCNPGPNSDYYNPWSAHNSSLISQGQGMHGYGNGYGMNPNYTGNHQSIPYSVYAPTHSGGGYYQPNNAYQSLPGQPIQMEFEEAEGDSPTPKEAEPDSDDDEVSIFDLKSNKFRSQGQQSGSNDFQPTGFRRRNTSSQPTESSFPSVRRPASEKAIPNAADKAEDFDWSTADPFGSEN